MFFCSAYEDNKPLCGGNGDDCWCQLRRKKIPVTAASTQPTTTKSKQFSRKKQRTFFLAGCRVVKGKMRKISFYPTNTSSDRSGKKTTAKNMLELNTNNSQKRNDVSKDKNWTEKEWKSLTTERTHSIKTPSVGWYAMGDHHRRRRCRSMCFDVDGKKLSPV